MKPKLSLSGAVIGFLVGWFILFPLIFGGGKQPAEPLTSKDLREYQKMTEEEIDTIRDRQDRMFQELTKRGSDIKW